MTTDFDKRKELNAQLRERSGNVRSHSALASFLYTLVRDYQQPGDVEQLVTNVILEDESVLYSNGFLARYAMDLADRLLAKERENLVDRASLAYDYFQTARTKAPEHTDRTHFINVIKMLVAGEFPR